MRVDIDSAYQGVEGLAYTTSLNAPIPNDVDPSDNVYQATVYSGPDFFINASLAEGQIASGEVITVTVAFGNRNQWPWDANDQFGTHISMTLPAEIDFLSAYTPWNPSQIWDPELIAEDLVVWGLGTLWSNNTYMLTSGWRSSRVRQDRTCPWYLPSKGIVLKTLTHKLVTTISST
jgi:hypothetical protein